MRRSRLPRVVDSSEPSPTTKPYSQSPPNNPAAERYLVHAYESIGHEERQLVDRLCKFIADEKDPVIFNQLVKQLDEVISRKEQRLREANPPDQPPTS